MISFVSGTLDSKEPGLAIVDVGGVGYEVSIPLSTYDRLPPVGELVKLHTHYHSRDGEITLFGFLTLDERLLFRTMLPVKGVGPSTALNILSRLTPNQFRIAVSQGNTDVLRRVPRLGSETAQLIVVQMQKKIKSLEFSEKIEGELGAPALSPEAVQALMTQGASQSVAEKAVAKAQKILGENAKLEEIIQLSLRYA